jgi:hypothetical protein
MRTHASQEASQACQVRELRFMLRDRALMRSGAFFIKAGLAFGGFYLPLGNKTLHFQGKTYNARMYLGNNSDNT